MKCDHVNQALKPRLSKATKINHHHQQELNHQAQVEATRGDAPIVDNDDDGGPIQPQSQVPHPRVHQNIQRDHPVDNILGSI